MRRVHSATGVSRMQMLTIKSEPHLVPLGSLLPEVDVAALFLDRISLPAMHIREETDVILPDDVSYIWLPPRLVWRNPMPFSPVS